MLRPQGFKNASSVRTASIILRLLICLPLERRWVSLLMHNIAGFGRVPSAGDDCVIQRDHRRELLVFDVSHVSHKEEKRLYLLVALIFISFLVVGYQATGDFSASPVSGLYQQQATASISLVSSQALSQLSGASRYRQFGAQPEMKASYRLITSATRRNINDGYVPFWCYQRLSIVKSFVVKYRPLPLEIDCSSAKMDGMEIRFLFEGRALLRISTRVKKAFPWLYHRSLGHFLCVHLQQQATTSISFGVVKVYLVRL
ncbi:predicted protein [Lichtheimia corymbifera JMRC:FSU:9682]|uniref:Uncharacterized protein n=1 Tax=Lichtheimia corymbifera JMRC:FSU:9682 TaxID=1263082 RepID=A0A068SEA5_9FUNG|nr:predicted protein [Lichtheimia corymbifera JMRC:FSU:9682]